jgi:D-beta-D-heptose 7-phosphate kinase/D-beta-D-heptose 1-phosphate adenosyltransferase
MNYKSDKPVSGRGENGLKAGHLSKIKTLEEARRLRERLRRSGLKLVFTNGCFDLLHPGHVRYLAAARAMGDHLLVAVNSDRSVRRIKGPSRPVQPEYVRAELLAALENVDSVILFDEETPLRAIETLLPDALVKGGDWNEEDIVGADVVRARGGLVRSIPFEEGFSTTALIERIREDQT